MELEMELEMETLRELKTSGYVLVVEDSLVQAKKLDFLFRSNSIQCQVCNNAKEAYDLVQKKPPILIVSDVVMPIMDGYEFCKLVKSNPEHSKIPVILLTSLQDSEDIIKGLQAGANNFISKPYEESFLIKQIFYLLNNRESDILPKEESVVSLVFNEKEYEIGSEKKQILDLLLSVYESTIQRNNELNAMKTQLENANESLKQVNSELESFANIVSQGLKFPLRDIVKSSNELLQNKNLQLPQEGEAYVESISNSATGMSELVSDLLNLAKSGMMDISREDIDFSSLAEEMVEVFKKREPARTIYFQIAPNLKVNGDPVLVKILLDKLLTDAFRATKGVENAEITIDRMDFFKRELLYIKDNGVGFNMAQFRPFEKEMSTIEGNESTVGLAIVKKIIERHGGRIWADSEVGSGTTYSFYL